MAAIVPLRPAGFWQRSVAWSLDAALIAPLAAAVAWPFMSAPAQALPSRTTALLQTAGQAMVDAIVDVVPVPQLVAALLHNPALHEASVDLQSTLWSATWPLLLAFALLSGAYHVACESSRRQATPGQRLLGLRVVDVKGHALAPGRALVRHLAGSLSWVTLNIGHLMAAMEPQRLALHDRLSATRVVKSGPMATGDADAGLPIWARIWLGALGIGALTLTVWGVTSAMTVMRIALEQALF